MAQSLDAEEDGERCGTAWEAVSGVALEHCQSRESILDLAARSVSADPDAIAGEPMAGDFPTGDCGDRQAEREWVAVRIADLIEDEDAGLVEAQEQAWADLDDACEGR